MKNPSTPLLVIPSYENLSHSQQLNYARAVLGFLIIKPCPFIISIPSCENAHMLTIAIPDSTIGYLSNSWAS